LVEAGALGVVLVDLQFQKARSAAQEIMGAYGGQVLAIATDVSNPQQVEEMVQTAANKFGRIDILINNAGICPVVAWDDVTLENWNRILAINLTGMFLCTRAVIPYMKALGAGRIVYISSPAAFSGSIVAHVGYGVSKAGVVALMKSVAKGFAADGILANAIAPGPMDTPMSHTFDPRFWEATEQKTLLKRHAEATEVADAVLFLASNRSTYITGQVLAGTAWSKGLDPMPGEIKLSQEISYTFPRMSRTGDRSSEDAEFSAGVYWQSGPASGITSKASTCGFRISPTESVEGEIRAGYAQNMDGLSTLIGAP
jgi:3-oxoacyl-[acyl-carrier protein] reductase